METISTPAQTKSLRAQVAGNTGSNGMISSYNAWQQRAPLGSETNRYKLSFLRLISHLVPNVKYTKN